jgi:uncharacterized membrane protein YfcA
LLTLSLLCLCAFLAGFIDSIVGGGGLILLPAVLVIHPELSLATALGTTKATSIWGTLTATIQYSRQIAIPWPVMIPSALSAFIFSLLGAYVVTLVSGVGLKPLILIVLLLVAIYTFVKKDFGKIHAPRRSVSTQRWIGLVAGAGLGFYDGFLGPGTGSFLIFVFIALMGFSFLAASASAKLINLSSNIAAVILFASTNNIAYHLAIPMALCSVLGAFLGSRLAILKGSGFVRILFLIVVIAVMTRLGYDTFLK